MKNMMKVVSMLIVAVMMLGMSLSAAAEEGYGILDVKELENGLIFGEQAEEETETPVETVTEQAAAMMYRVTFYDFYGNEVYYQEVEQGGYVQAMEFPPQMEGFTFDHWFDGQDEAMLAYAFENPVQCDVGLYPFYMVNETIEEKPVLPTYSEAPVSAPDTILGAGMLEMPAQQPEAILSDNSPQTTYETDQQALILSIVSDTLGITEMEETDETEEILAEDEVEETEEIIEEMPVEEVSAESLIESLNGQKAGKPDVESIMNAAKGNGDTLLSTLKTETEELPAPLRTLEAILAQGENDEENEDADLTEIVDVQEDSDDLETVEEETEAVETDEDVNDDEDAGEETADEEDASEEEGEEGSEEEALVDLEDDEMLTEIEDEDIPLAGADMPFVTVDYEVDEDAGDGVLVTVKATLHNLPENLPEGVELAYQWQNDANGEFADVEEATGDSYTFKADTYGQDGCNWRVNVELAA